MDPYQLWKDDYRHEVEAVLAERRRAREAGRDAEDGAPEEFQGRIVDLIIPPAGAHAEALALKDRLAVSESARAELESKLAAAVESAGRERARRERIKDAAAKLALDVRGLQGDRATALERARMADLRASDAVASAEGRVRALEAEVERSAARVESEERTAAARLQSLRDTQARLDKLLIEKDADAAEITSLRRRFDAAVARSEESEKRELEVERRLKEALALRDLIPEGPKVAALAKRLNDALEALKAANERADKDAIAARDALEESRASEARAVALATQAELLKVRAIEEAERLRIELAGRLSSEAAASGRRDTAELLEAQRLRAEAQNALEESRHLENEFAARVASAIAEERTQTDLQRMIASQSLEKARSLEKESLQRLEDAETKMSEEGARLMAEAEKRAAAAPQPSPDTGADDAKSRVEKAESALAASQKSEAEATLKIQELIRTLSEYRGKMKEFSAKVNERIASEKSIAETAVAEALRREAELKAHLDSMAGGNSAALEEERAKMRAEFEDMRAQLESKVDEERRQLQARWKEQAILLEKLRQARDRKPESGS
jgi:hypothetical protein